ncbi:hypothetical protein ACFOWE_08415 [Planomonospora corallina]|uniref:Cysteinyl-tRNA synthetase n=1 Tax=Planomonospora corallina TaxID=1806052 RepID=A0ABV8I5X1_9ACTN
MLRLHDISSGRAERVVPESARALRVHTCAPPAGRRPDLGDLRPHLLADLVRRVCERHRVRVVLHRVAEEDGLRADTLALNMRPAEHTPGIDDPADPALAEVRADAVLLETVTGQRAVRRIGCGPVRLAGRETAGDPRESREAVQSGDAGRGAVTLADVAAAGLDPLAVRLALLGHRYREAADLSWDALEAADRTLRLLRSRVAEWSEAPSSPMPAGHVARIEAALDDDLDTPSALRLLAELERDDTLAPGSRFEAFLHLDMVLALDLPADIGRPPAHPGP